MKNILYVVIPCYNEEDVFPTITERLKIKMQDLIKRDKISTASKVVFVNDGSKDKTWDMIEQLTQKDTLFGGICLSRNKGHQNALLAGLMEVIEHADMVITMDADLQDDINAMDEMIERFLAGIDIVYGVRRKRDSDSFFKRVTAEGYYKFMKFMYSDLIFNHADYRLMSRRALEGLSEFKEVNLFLRGIIPMIGYPSDFVYYDRSKRFAGESKYPFGKMLIFAMEGITSLSVKPLRLITFLGIFIFLVSIGILIYSIIRHFIGETIVGWTTLMVSIWAIGGLILFSIGIVGEYVGKIYLESKGRPRYIIEKSSNID
ncbi:glycosyltransferase family 2 protein [Kineothrix sp. MB12-C1]|nr:glycosyltransferase family 2 protein [Kineothrix sp. MB12-C1]WMC94442.1 glycosyltransferase family 2 protein [Kineothrix sp. MB12-C1]